MKNPLSHFPKYSSSGRKKSRTLALLFLVSALFLATDWMVPLEEAGPLKEQMFQASQTMAHAEDVLKECRKRESVPLSEKDVNYTGMIGRERTPITTSKGHLQAKRTSTNPNFAGLIAYLLKKAGVEKNGSVAMGASGSFPALIVASLSAVREVEARPLLICSLGASQWGANIPRFNFLRMHECLLEKGIFKNQPTAVSLGGIRDTGEEMDPPGKSFLIGEIRRSGLPFIYESNLRKNVETRMSLYQKEADSKKIQAFINIGGSFSNLGTDSQILNLNPGLTKISQIPPQVRRGMIYEMASRGIPVIHLLNMKGLVQKYGLPWDPFPLPDPGEGEMYRLLAVEQESFFYLFLVYAMVVAGLLVFRKRIG